MGKKSKKKNAAKNSSKKQNDKSRSYNIMTKEGGVSSEQEILDLISVIEERPSEHCGQGLFFCIKTPQSSLSSVIVQSKDDDNDGKNSSNNIVILTEGTRYKTLNPKLGKLLLPFPFKLNSPLCPPWEKILFFCDAKEEEGDKENSSVVVWMDYIAKEKYLANCWSYYEYDRLVKNATMKQLATVVGLEQDYCDGGINQKEAGTKKEQMDFVRIKAIEVKFLKDINDGDELVRAYGHDWLCIKVCYLQNIKKKILFSYNPDIAANYTRILMDTKSLTMVDVTFSRQDEPWTDEEINMICAAEKYQHESLVVANVEDIEAWSVSIADLASCFLEQSQKNDDDDNDHASIKLFRTHWESAIHYLESDLKNALKDKEEN